MVGPRLHGSGLSFSFFCFILTAAAQRTDPAEVYALVQIKRSLIDPNNHLKSWNKGDPCNSNWTGVWCFDRVGTDGYLHVHELYLMTSNLSGSLAPELGLLSRLQIMNFMWNDLTGTIPKEIGDIKSLKLLLLNGNKLSGSLPDELGNLSNLNRFQVDLNQLSGPIPQSFANLASVKHLHLNNNSFTGQIPRELSKLPKLLHLLVDNNNFTGHLPPEFSMLMALRILQVDNNNFSGAEIPSTYANFSKLVKLSLRNCSLEGAVPDLSSIIELTYLDLSWNHLTGSVPPKKLSDNITTIDLSNNQINGSIAESFILLPSLQRLSLANNSFSGSIPIGILLNMSNRDAKLTIDLRNNSFSDISGSSSLPANITLRLAGNPICKNSNVQDIIRYCDSEGVESDKPINSASACLVQSCPRDESYEYVPASPVHCYCASPLRIGYRLKSPSFSYFTPYRTYFESYLAQDLYLDSYQVWIDSIAWEAGPRLRMYLKLYPSYNDSLSYVFNISEVRRIQGKFGSWNFTPTDFFGPYELLNFTLLGPYEHLIGGETNKRKISTTVLIVAIIAAIVCATVISAIVTLVIAKRLIKCRPMLSRNPMSSNIFIKIDGVQAFTLKELAHATNNFCSSTIVGRGGYGKVYKGILSDETVVAIKRADEGSLQGQREFLTEIELLSRLHHRNLVSLVGYCNEGGEQILVYEFMHNGTLREWILGKRKGNLNFGKRLRIAMGAAKGILYLHTEANPPIFHRDIKSSNILLDRILVAKVADFGLSRLAPYMDAEGNMPKYVSTENVRGTPGYIDPDYFLNLKFTDKSDVYSLGIVFLELLTSMHPILHGRHIVREVNEARECGTISSIIDSKMGSYPSDCVEKFINLGLSCCHENPEERPCMTGVVRELEIILSMLPDSETAFPDSSSDFSGKMASTSTSSSTSYMARDGHQHMSSPMLPGSNLVSDVIPTIVPR